MMKTYWGAIFALAVLLTGCGSKEKTAEAMPEPVAENGASDEAPVASNQAPETQEGEMVPVPVKPISHDTIPADLKHDAYHYYGLNNLKPLNMEITIDGGAPSSGTQSISLVKVDSNEAVFRMDRTGGLSAFGSMELVLKPDGVYLLKASVGRVQEAAREMPAALKPGETWTTSGKMTLPGGSSVEESGSYKVVGFEKVTTKRQTYPGALLVQSEGKVIQGSETATMRTKNWFVKDRGPVKVEIELIDPQGTQRKILMQETP